ncbi:MAG: phosphoribosylformylglycinamidine synthase, partial [Lachnospiraceae bacterium]|nr:phosphoribosylformylglycinamidine synthase [Lachnospiraceae bacterium]
MVYRIFVEKKEAVANEAKALLSEVKTFLGISKLENLRIVNRYDVEGIGEELFEQCVSTVFSEPQVDEVYKELDAGEGLVFAVEALPGQYDQRADSAAQCIQIISQEERPLVKCAKVYILYGDLTADEVDAIKKHVINPVEMREASLEMPQTLKMEYDTPETVVTIVGFRDMGEAPLKSFL